MVIRIMLWCVCVCVLLPKFKGMRGAVQGSTLFLFETNRYDLDDNNDVIIYSEFTVRSTPNIYVQLLRIVFNVQYV
jgi:hypothetical protein